MIYCHSVTPSCYIENQSGGRLRLPSLPIPSDSCKHDDFRLFNRARRNFSDCGGFSVMYNSLVLETVIVLLYLIAAVIVTFIIKNAVCRRIDF